MRAKLALRVTLFACLVAACVPAAPEPAPTAPPEPATPTPEIFIPLNPSPTPSSSSLPLTCQVTDLGVYLSQAGGYCLAYPSGFTLDESAAELGSVAVLGPALDQSLEPVRASLEVALQPVPAGSDLARLVDAYLTQAGFRDLPQPIERTARTLGGQPAEQLTAVPGRLSSTVILALRDNDLFTLRFSPSDAPVAQADFDALFQTVTGSFAFTAETTQLTEPAAQSVTWSEFGQTISLAFDPRLAPWVEAATVPEVPVSGDVLFSESHPAYAQFRFLGFQGGRPYDLPLLPFDNRVAQVMVFPTAAFAGFGDDDPHGFAAQWLALQDLLELGLEPDRCAQPLETGERALPFLPWLNARQVFCAQAALLDFAAGSGVRYLTFYAQDESPALDQWIFYTFQGVTDDGQFYVSAVFPVATGVFPTEPPANQVFPDPTYWTVLADQLTRLNAQSPEAFAPRLETLDALVQSIQIQVTASARRTSPRI